MTPRPFFLILLTSLLFSLAGSPIRAGGLPWVGIGAPDSGDVIGAEDYLQQLSDLDEQIKECEAKLAELQTTERNLNNEIAYMASQIQLTSLEIAKTQTEILAKEEELAGLRADIGDLEGRIQVLSDLLTEQERIFQSRARENYKASRFSPFEIVLDAPSISRLVERIKYLRVLELQDRRLIGQMQETREGCATQKQLLENKKRQVEELKAEIEAYKRRLENKKASLAKQRAERDALLKATRGEATKYAELLDQLLAEKKALESIYLEGLKDGSAVKAGQPIALIGNSGAPCCSTGAHLHFEVRECDETGASCTTVDPAKYLSETELIYAGDEVGKINARGDWPWPVESPRITQEYGETFWTRRGWMYKFHTGIDMTSNESSTIKAVADGTMYRSSTTCGKSCGANYVAIDHGDGLWTIYFHVQ